MAGDIPVVTKKTTTFAVSRRMTHGVMYTLQPIPSSLMDVERPDWSNRETRRGRE